MIYQIRRFSYQEALKDGNEYILSQVDSGLGKIEDLSDRIIEDPRLKDLKPVKRYGKPVKSLAQLLRRKKKKEKSKKYSETPVDPTTNINTSEANKFKTALGRLSITMGNSGSQDILK